MADYGAEDKPLERIFYWLCLSVYFDEGPIFFCRKFLNTCIGTGIHYMLKERDKDNITSGRSPKVVSSYVTSYDVINNRKARTVKLPQN